MTNAALTTMQHPPSWLDIALRILADDTQLALLTPEEHETLFQKAVMVMKPSREEWELLGTDITRRQAYIMAYIRAYRAGLPPLSGFSDITRPAQA